MECRFAFFTTEIAFCALSINAIVKKQIVDRDLARAFYFMEAATQSCHAAAMNMILIILLLLILLGGGGFYIGGPAIGGSGLGLILLIVIIVYLMGGFRGRK